jgi:hypothetical protein
VVAIGLWSFIGFFFVFYAEARAFCLVQIEALRAE